MFIKLSFTAPAAHPPHDCFGPDRVRINKGHDAMCMQESQDGVRQPTSLCICMS